MKIIDNKYDERTKCYSILTTMKLSEYYDLSKDTFAIGGNIDGQRDVQKTASASKIRKRMIDDFSRGALFPPVVLGLVSNESFEDNEVKDLIRLKNCLKNDSLSIIDGMQRTNVYFNSLEKNLDREIRVEFWIADVSTKLLYRMLVLNTGQVPWNTRRQIEVIYKNLINQIESEIKLRYPDLEGQTNFMNIDDQQRRSSGGFYQKSAIIESYIGYTTRKLKINMNDEIANEFQRFDMMDSLENDESFTYFIDTLANMILLDIEFTKFDNGKGIFSSIPACVGFMVASGEFVLGKIYAYRDKEKCEEKNVQYKKQMNNIIEKIINENEKGNEEFLGLDSLKIIIENQPKGRIGDELRNMYKNAFLSMLKDDEFAEITNLKEFWSE